MNDDLFQALRHGDDEHQEWLREAIECFFSGKPIPDARGGGRKDARILELERQLQAHLTREDKVKKFRDAGNKLNYIDNFAEYNMIVNVHDEETGELYEAIDDYVANPTEETRAQLCKEWADCQYTLSQIALFFDIPADASFDRVHDSNMTKIVDGKVIYRADGKILKPESYQKPDMRGL